MFGKSLKNFDNKTDTSLFLQKPYLRSDYKKTNIEEDIDMINQFRIQKLPVPIITREVVSQIYVDNKFKDPSIIKSSTLVDFNDRSVDNVRFVKLTVCLQLEKT